MLDSSMQIGISPVHEQFVNGTTAFVVYCVNCFKENHTVGFC